jgi:hypothetical protein
MLKKQLRTSVEQRTYWVADVRACIAAKLNCSFKLQHLSPLISARICACEEFSNEQEDAAGE